MDDNDNDNANESSIHSPRLNNLGNSFTICLLFIGRASFSCICIGNFNVIWSMIDKISIYFYFIVLKLSRRSVFLVEKNGLKLDFYSIFSEISVTNLLLRIVLINYFMNNANNEWNKRENQIRSFSFLANTIMLTHKKLCAMNAKCLFTNSLCSYVINEN